ncbi:trimethylguanosine synthase [Monosporozyma servazzii]
MGKKLIHASRFTKSLAKRSPRRYSRLKPVIDNDTFKIDPSKPVKEKRLWKYWKNRKTLFSQINNGKIYMTSELWFSVTPEYIAQFLANFIKSCIPNARCVMDVFSGGGGNAIQFAKQFPRVIGVDNNLDHLYCTAMNSKAYGVEDNLWLRCASWSTKFVQQNRSWLQKEQIDCVFASPPWGGPEYLHADTYDLEKMLIPMGITPLLKTFKQLSSNIILFLPRNSSLTQVAQATREVFGIEEKCKVLYVKQNGYMKGMLCIWGAPFINYQTEGENVVNLSDIDSDIETTSPAKTSTANIDLYDIQG